MKTEIFKDYAAFRARPDKDINGVTQEFASAHSDWTNDRQANLKLIATRNGVAIYRQLKPVWGKHRLWVIENCYFIRREQALRYAHIFGRGRK